MKNPFLVTKRLRSSIWILSIIAFASCSERFVVLSDTNAYHIKSGVVFVVNPDSSLSTYEQFTMTTEEYKRLLESRYSVAASRKDDFLVLDR